MFSHYRGSNSFFLLFKCFDESWSFKHLPFDSQWESNYSIQLFWFHATGLWIWWQCYNYNHNGVSREFEKIKLHICNYYNNPVPIRQSINWISSSGQDWFEWFSTECWHNSFLKKHFSHYEDNYDLKDISVLFNYLYSGSQSCWIHSHSKYNGRAFPSRPVYLMKPHLPQKRKLC